jgi:D-sedoheptulose 7-phosphate isomerase
VTQQYVREQLRITASLFEQVKKDDALIDAVAAAGKICAQALAHGNKIMLAGNGGSAADAQHIAAEFVSRLAIDRRPLPALALTTDTSILTAAGNDYGFETVFERQVQALAAPGDVLIGISTSGKSPNIIRALQAARSAKAITIGLTGGDGGRMPELCDVIVRVPSNRTQNIQEVHIMVGHTICALAEQEFLPTHKKQHPTAVVGVG